MKKDLGPGQIRISFEPSRLMEEFLAKAYEAVIPMLFKPISDRDQNFIDEVEGDDKQNGESH